MEEQLQFFALNFYINIWCISSFLNFDFFFQKSSDGEQLPIFLPSAGTRVPKLHNGSVELTNEKLHNLVMNLRTNS
jgi:hypothetical protein